MATPSRDPSATRASKFALMSKCQATRFLVDCIHSIPLHLFVSDKGVSDIEALIDRWAEHTHDVAAMHGRQYDRVKRHLVPEDKNKAPTPSSRLDLLALWGMRHGIDKNIPRAMLDTLKKKNWSHLYRWDLDQTYGTQDPDHIYMAEKKQMWPDELSASQADQHAQNTRNRFLRLQVVKVNPDKMIVHIPKDHQPGTQPPIIKTSLKRKKSTDNDINMRFEEMADWMKRRDQVHREGMNQIRRLIDTFFDKIRESRKENDRVAQETRQEWSAAMTAIEERLDMLEWDGGSATYALNTPEFDQVVKN